MEVEQYLSINPIESGRAAISLHPKSISLKPPAIDPANLNVGPIGPNNKDDSTPSTFSLGAATNEKVGEAVTNTLTVSPLLIQNLDGTSTYVENQINVTFTGTLQMQNIHLANNGAILERIFPGLVARISGVSNVYNGIYIVTGAALATNSMSLRSANNSTINAQTPASVPAAGNKIQFYYYAINLGVAPSNVVTSIPGLQNETGSIAYFNQHLYLRTEDGWIRLTDATVPHRSIRGFKGLKGNDGVQGDTGQPGSQGPIGAKGYDGYPGVVGLPGPRGDQGPDGPMGFSGESSVISDSDQALRSTTYLGETGPAFAAAPFYNLGAGATKNGEVSNNTMTLKGTGVDEVTVTLQGNTAFDSSYYPAVNDFVRISGTSNGIYNRIYTTKSASTTSLILTPFLKGAITANTAASVPSSNDKLETKFTSAQEAVVTDTASDGDILNQRGVYLGMQSEIKTNGPVIVLNHKREESELQIPVNYIDFGPKIIDYHGRFINSLTNTSMLQIWTKGPNASPLVYFDFRKKADNSYEIKTKLSSDQLATPSDRRIKDDIVSGDLDLCDKNIARVKLRKFKWNDEYQKYRKNKDSTCLGVIAQEIKSVFPKSLSSDVADNHLDIKNGHYIYFNKTELFYTMLGCLQNLIKKTETLETQIL
eukprot:jgi/Bigna1/129960/aug1.10_g4668